MSEKLDGDDEQAKLRGVPARLRALLDTVPQGTHLTRMEIYDLTKAAGWSLSLSTIYRALDKLYADGLVSAIRTRRTMAFEGVTERPVHEHLICFHCGEAIECETIFSQLGEQIAKYHGFDFEHSELILKGICEKCQKLPDSLA